MKAKVKTVSESTAPSSDLPEGWASTTLGNIASKLVDGSHNPPPKQATGHPMLSARNIGDGILIFDEAYRFISVKDFKVEHARSNVAPGDVLLTIVGSIGRSVVVPKDTEPFALQRSVAVIRPILVDPNFLAFSFRAPFSQSFFDENAAGTAQKGVYLRTLAKMPVLLAPLAEQRRIVAKIDELLGRLNACREHFSKATQLLGSSIQTDLSTNHVNGLARAILAKAFRGELVPTEAELARREGREHEPASLLLERIRAERDGMGLAPNGNPKGRKKSRLSQPT